MNMWKKLLKSIGPGFITGASDDDPSGIATYAQTGARFGYSQLWTSFFTTPFMIVIQEMCGRIGLVTGKGLSSVIKKHYSAVVLWFAVMLLLVANTVNIGADLGAMAESMANLVPLPFAIWLILITLMTLVLQVLIRYKTYAKFLKYLTLSLFAYIVTVFLVHQDWEKVISGFLLPSLSLDHEYVLNVVAILGTTISPYLFFWQANEEVEEMDAHRRTRLQGHRQPNERDIWTMQIDTTVGMVFSNVIMFFIIVTTASTLGVHGIQNIDSAVQAADALRPFAGDFAFMLFALGIIGTGLLAVPVLSSSASYALCEIIGKPASLDSKFHEARVFYGIIILTTVIGVLVNFLPFPSFKLLYYTAVLNGLCAPPLMILILLIATNKSIMGHFRNNTFSTVLGIIITAVMSAASLYLLWTMVWG